MITTSGRRRSASATAALAVGGLADRRGCAAPREREAQPFAYDLVVVRDEAGDLVGHYGDSTAPRRMLLLSERERELPGLRSSRWRRRARVGREPRRAHTER